MSEKHEYSKRDLVERFDATVGEKVGKLDTQGFFEQINTVKKNKGIVGKVIEESILGYSANSSSDPDLIVDGKEVELKSTGIKKGKKQNGPKYLAKESMTVTAVSPSKITKENFGTSQFWHKLDEMLVVYYLYDADQTVEPLEYKEFPILGYQFHVFDEDDKKKLKNDWTIVRDYIKHLQETREDPTTGYSEIHQDTKAHLMMINIAPRWPKPPRFRLKPAVVTTMFLDYYEKRKLEKLDVEYNSFAEFDEHLRKMANDSRFKDKKISEIAKILGIEPDKDGKFTKSVGEAITVKMFGGKATKMSRIDYFMKLGIVPKTIVQTGKGGRTEDTKMVPIDLEEIGDPGMTFEKSSVLDSFADKQFLFIMFEEPSSKAPLSDNKFLGFKRINFTESFIEGELRPVWEKVHSLIINDKLKETVCLDKRTGKPRINEKSGTIRTALNFPKSSEGNVFVRGTGENASEKNTNINGLKVYRQDFWIKGRYLVELLRKYPFL